MRFFAFGLNHEKASVARREAFAMDAEAMQYFYRGLELSPDAELVLLSTCNRTEAYLYGTMPDVERVKQSLAARAARDWPEEPAFNYKDEAAIRHVLEVAAGVRSQVLGDNQILAQLKEAYGIAVDEGQVETVMHRLMHTAFRAAKRVVTETGLAEGAASISTLAVSAVQEYFSPGEEPLEGRDILLLGAGEMGEGVLYTLTSHPLGRLVVTNRTDAVASKLAAETGADIIRWDRRYDHLHTFDAVIVATGASEPVLDAERMPEKSSTEAPTLLVDIALPRNIDPAVGECSGYTLVDLDALNHRMEETEDERASEVPAAEQICQEALTDFVSWVFHQQALQPAIETLRQTFENIRRKEVERHHSRFDALDREELDRITQSIMQKLLAVPIVRLKDAADDNLDLAQRVELLHTLFAQPGSDESQDVNAMEECPYVREHVEENKVWRPVADYMRHLADIDEEDSHGE
jgi:glutamyl-tRNA reductase